MVRICPKYDTITNMYVESKTLSLPLCLILSMSLLIHHAVCEESHIPPP